MIASVPSSRSTRLSSASSSRARPVCSMKVSMRTCTCTCTCTSMHSAHTHAHVACACTWIRVYLHASRATRLLHEGLGLGFGFGFGLACSMKVSSASNSMPSSMHSRAAVSCCCCLHAHDGGIGVFHRRLRAAPGRHGRRSTGARAMQHRPWRSLASAPKRRGPPGPTGQPRAGAWAPGAAGGRVGCGEARRLCACVAAADTGRRP